MLFTCSKCIHTSCCYEQLEYEAESLLKLLLPLHSFNTSIAESWMSLPQR